MIEKIDHIGIVVKDLEKALKVYSTGLGLHPKKIERLDEHHVKIAFIPVGEVLVELLEPTGPGMIENFLREKGEGLHHICYKVDNLERAMDEIGETIAFRDKVPRRGAADSKIAFLDPREIFNTETELVERKIEV